jgi:hypothetical protein
MKIKLSELRQMVKSVIKEQSTADIITGKISTSDYFDSVAFAAKGKHLVGQQVRLYFDEANTKDYNFIKITKFELKGVNLIIYYTETGRTQTYNFVYHCGKNFMISDKGTFFYNKKFIEDLKKAFCTTSAGGKPVINIGTYSQTDQKQPMNVAESKLRKIVK